MTTSSPVSPFDTAYPTPVSSPPPLQVDTQSFADSARASAYSAPIGPPPGFIPTKTQIPQCRFITFVIDKRNI
jgi:hypothetical protein